MSSSIPEPLVLVPGLLCTAELFAPQWPMLAPGRPVLVAEQRHDDDLPGMAARLLAATPPRFALCGLSMGGYVAFEVMRRAPERVARLALLDTSARGATPETNAPREQMIALAARGAFAEVVGLLWQRLVAAQRHADQGLRAIVERMAEETGAAAFIRQQRAIMARPDSRPMLRGITVPALVLVGDEDVITPAEHSREIADGIGAAAHLVTLPACGHLSSLERPEAVTAALRDWLARR